ncbi:MAG: SPFH domain-containing protein, partial [Anaerolineae bacterium]
MRLVGVLLVLGLVFLAGYFVAWSLSLLVAVLGAFVLWRAFGVYRALPALLMLLVGTAFLLGGGLTVPLEHRGGRSIQAAIHDGVVSGKAPAEIIVQVGQLVDSRRVPADSVERISQGLENVESQVENLRLRIVTEELTRIQEKVEAQGIARQAGEQAEKQALEQATEKRKELTEQLATELAGQLTQQITAGRVWDFVARGLLAAAVAVVMVLLVSMACAEVLIVHRGGNRPAAYQMMLALLAAPLFPTGNPLSALFSSATRSFRAIQIVQDGQVIYSRPSSEDFRMPGPGILVIRSGSAALLERSGKITRIVGPGFYLTESFEHLSALVDLTLQSESWESRDILTKDSVPLEVRFTVQYRIMIDQPALITKAEYRLDEDAIRRAILTTVDWKEQTKVIAGSILRDTIATRFLDEIYNPRSRRFSTGSGGSSRVPLQHELRRRLGRESQRWGVEIVRVTVDRITLPRELEAAKVVRDAAELKAERAVIEAQAEADAQTIKGRARAIAEAERFREVLL